MSFFRNLNPDSHYEHQVRQQQLKLISKRRFYEILEAAEDFYQDNHAEKFGLLKEQRGTNHVTKGFKNRPVYGNANMKFTFRTNNNINQYASHANFSHNDGSPYIEFVINTTENPIVKNLDFSNLNYFEIAENAKTYSFNIYNYLGGRQINPHEIGLIYECTVERNGEYDFDMDDTERILTPKDTPPKNTHYLDSNDMQVLD
jgi:hypothetical protein